MIPSSIPHSIDWNAIVLTHYYQSCHSLHPLITIITIIYKCSSKYRYFGIML